jgi:hypothetical protein
MEVYSLLISYFFILQKIFSFPREHKLIHEPHSPAEARSAANGREMKGHRGMIKNREY